MPQRSQQRCGACSERLWIGHSRCRRSKPPAVERTRDDGDLEVAAAGAVVQGAVGAGEGMCEERADRVGRHGNDGNEGLSDRMGSRIAFPTSFPERAPLAGGRGKP